MPNPWDRQPRQVTRPPAAELPTNAELVCPACRRPTDSLKQYRYVSRVIFFLAGTFWETPYYRACPACMRRLIVRRAAMNLIPANVLWFVYILPWGLGLILASYQKGHSRMVLRQVTPEEAAAHEATADARSGRQAVAVLALLLCWLPVFGLGVALGSWLVNRKAGNWQRPVSRIALTLSGLIHLTFLVLIAVKG